MTKRANLVVGCLAGVLAVTGVLALPRDDRAPVALRAAGDHEATTWATEPTTTETSAPTTTTSSSPPTTRRPRPKVVATIESTIALRPLQLNRVRITVGAPCRNAATTTTDNGGGIMELDGCWLFVYWPVEESDVHVRVVSDHGLAASTISAPCQTNQGECHAYIGPVYERAAGDRECFWLVTTDLGWVPLSNPRCVTWPQRPEIAESPA